MVFKLIPDPFQGGIPEKELGVQDGPGLKQEFPRPPVTFNQLIKTFSLILYNRRWDNVLFKGPFLTYNFVCVYIKKQLK